MNYSFMERVWGQFDKLLLTFILMVFIGVAIYFEHRSADGESLKWATGTVGILIGSLTTLIQGSRMLARKGDGSNGNGNGNGDSHSVTQPPVSQTGVTPAAPPPEAPKP